MNHRAAGGRDCQGRAGDQGNQGTKTAMDGCGMDGLAGWKCERVGAGRGGGDYGECWGDWEVRSMAYCQVVSRSRLESSLRIPGQRRGRPPFQFQAGQGRGRRRRETQESSGAPIAMWNRVRKRRAGMERLWRPRPMNTGGPARVSSCRFRRTEELLCVCVCRDKCVEAGTLSDMAVPLRDWVMHGLPSKEDVPPKYPDTGDMDCG